MPFRWSHLFKEENSLAKAAAQRQIDGHANQHDLVALSIRQLQDSHDQLEHACAVVIGEYNTAKAKLERDLAKEKELDIRGRAASGAGHTEAATAIAHQLVIVRNLIATEQPAFEHAQTAAEKAKAAFAENSETLAAKMEEAKQLDAEIDEAAVKHNINEAMKAVSSVTAHDTPSFDEVRDRVRARSAEEDATTELESANPELSEIHDQHLLSVAAADDVMAGWGPPVEDAVIDKPAARLAQHQSARQPAASPLDRLNS